MKIYTYKRNKNKIKIKFFGITVYKEDIVNGFKVKSYLGGIYKLKQDNSLKKYYLFGIQYRVKKYISDELTYLCNQITNKIFKVNQRLITAAAMHTQSFARFKGVFRGKSVVLVAAGPTVKYFKKIPDAIYIGCNRAFLNDNINFDFLFSIDKIGIEKWYEDFFSYRDDKCIKFIGDQNLGEKFQIPENKIPLQNVYRYITDAGLGFDAGFNLDISTSPLKNAASVSVQAMQFILYTQPAKIYLVGIDCTVSQKQYFIGDAVDNASRNEDAKTLDNINVKCWQQIKTFADTYYPDTEIISVNPVRLKGIYKDYYTVDKSLVNF